MDGAGILTINNVVNAPDLLVWEHRSQDWNEENGRLVISLSGIGPEGDGLPGLEFAKTATGGGKNWVLYIADPKRTWLNGPGLIERITDLVARKRAEIGARRVCAIGHSMGAFSAAVLPGFMPVDVAMCFSPQSSVHPEVIPQEARWAHWREQISDFRIQQVADHISPETQYVVLFGQRGKDLRQRRLFPRGENIELHVMPQTHHNTAQKFRSRRILDHMVGLAFDEKIYRFRRQMRRIYGARLVSGRSHNPAGVTA